MEQKKNSSESTANAATNQIAHLFVRWKRSMTNKEMTNKW